MPQPTDDFHWCTTGIPGVDIVEPPVNKQDIGWLSQEKPPYQYFNWLFNVLGQWLDFVAEIGGGSSGVVPIGSLMLFDDLNGVNTFNADLFTDCDGKLINDADSPYDGLNIRDMSGLAIVGLGTIGGGDIGTAPYSAAPVGNADNTINIQHSHTVNAHSHDLANHTHTGPSHTHTGPSHTHTMGNHTHTGPSHSHNTTGLTDAVAATGIADFTTGPGNLNINSVNDGTQGQHSHGINLNTNAAGTGATGGPSTNTTDAAGTGATGASGTGATGAPSVNTSGNASPGTNNQLSTAQSIQPRSSPVRILLRYK